MAPVMAPKEDLQKDLSDLKQQMDNLHKINKDLFFESGLNGENLLEPIWKTPAVQKEIQKQVNDISQKLSGDLKNIQDLLNLFDDNKKNGPEKK
jgi:regulator of replication initiation timing